MYEWIGGEFSHDELIAAFDRLDNLDVWLDGWDGSRRAQARLKNLTSQLIGRFAGAATRATRREQLRRPRASSGSVPTSSSRPRSRPRSPC